MFITGLFLLSFGMVYSYNVDSDFPIVFSQSSTIVNSLFGYTVHLYYDQSNGTSWLLIGAPKGNYSMGTRQKHASQVEPGVVYRCSIHGNEVEEITPQILDNEEGYIAQLRMKMLVKKQRAWFGSAISIDESANILTVCAPRTIVTILNPFTNFKLDTMQGMCYSGKLSWNLLDLEDRDLKFHDFKSPFWYNPLHGFSVQYAREMDNKSSDQTGINRIIGEPKHESYGTVDILYSDKRMTVELPTSDELSQFGYSVESGCFFKKNQLLFASSDPGWHYVGMVGIINPETKNLVATKLHGSKVGEFFGGSMSVGDINNDGLDDLLVGAPYWGEDNGKVYIYFGSPKGQFEAALTLFGNSDGAYFGYAIASGDLDADGFDDIIVGAPWEGNGAIYIYNGGADIKDANLQISQRIDADMLSENRYNIQRFGFSISKPVDIDENGYLDVAVGAYKSQHAVILQSKPIVKTELIIETIPDTLRRDAKQFIIKLCPKYSGYNIKKVQESKITITIDERYQRTKETILELNYSSLNLNTCLSTQINISKNVKDYIEPINILAKHEFVYDKSSGTFCKFCPVEKRNNQLQTAQIQLPFNIDCGEDKVCNCNISASVKFHNVRYDNTWVIGSNDVNLEISLKNDGEPAYLTIVEVIFPEGVVLRSILPSCQEDTSKEDLIVTCDVGNPIWKGEEKNIKLDLDMRHLDNTSTDDNTLHFYVSINTRSKNLGTTNVHSILNLVNEVSLSLRGKANEEAYYLTTLTDASPNISFQHTYQVYKLGASPLEEAQLVIKVPVSIKNSETLVHIYKSELYVSGEYFECSSANGTMESELIEVQGEPSLDHIDMTLFSDELYQNESSHGTVKRDLNEKAIPWLYDAKHLKNPKTINDTSQDITYVNCSTPDINCITIVCNLEALKTLQDIGKMVIKLLLDINKLKDSLSLGNEKLILKFSTMASAEIKKPTVRLFINGTKPTEELVTTIYNSPKMEKLQLWIVMVSVLVGLLLLLIFAAFLSTLGFFNRKGREGSSESKIEQDTQNGTVSSNKCENKL